jgi:hypothetical protein
MPQDLPPVGGYEPVQYKVRIDILRYSNWHSLVAICR